MSDNNPRGGRGGSSSSANPAASRGGRPSGGAATGHHRNVSSGNSTTSSRHRATVVHADDATVDNRARFPGSSPYARPEVPPNFNNAYATATASPSVGFRHMNSPSLVNATMVTHGVAAVDNASGYYNVGQAPMVPSPISPTMHGLPLSNVPYGAVVASPSPYHSPLNAQATPFGFTAQHYSPHPQFAVPAPISPQSTNTFMVMGSPRGQIATPSPFQPMRSDIQNVPRASGPRPIGPPAAQANYPRPPGPPPAIRTTYAAAAQAPARQSGPGPARQPARVTPAQTTTSGTQTTGVPQTTSSTQTVPVIPVPGLNPDLPKSDVDWTINLGHQKLAMDRSLGLLITVTQNNCTGVKAQLEQAKAEATELAEMARVNNTDKYTLQRRTNIANMHLERVSGMLDMVTEMIAELGKAEANNKAKPGVDGLVEKLSRQEDREVARKGIEDMLAGKR